MSTATVKAGEGFKQPTLDLVHKRAQRILKGTAVFEDRFVPDQKELVNLVDVLRSMGCKVVLTMGVWDLFHIGHAEYIRRGKEEALKRYPDADHIIMVVAVDTDALTKKRKGPTRPIVPEDERVRVLSHLRVVDVLTLEHTMGELPEVLPHDVRVISTSTTDIKDIKEQERFCEHLVNLPPQADTTTTARIRQLALDGQLETVKKIVADLRGIAGSVNGALEKVLADLPQEIRDELSK